MSRGWIQWLLALLVSSLFSSCGVLGPSSEQARAPGTGAGSTQPTSLELFTNPLASEAPPPPSDWFWTAAVKDALNVDIKVSFVADTSQYNPKLQARAAANDLPDLFQTNATQMAQLVNQGLVGDWGPYLEMMPNYVRDHDVKALAPAGTFAGKQYGLVSKATFPYKTITVVRKDWLDRLGLAVPKTLDEFMTVMKAFRGQDPNGTGLRDTYGYSANIASDGSLSHFDPIFGAFDALGPGTSSPGWRIESGSLVPIITSPQRREALQFISRMEQSGVLDPDWKAQKEENFRLKWKGGKIGLFSEDWCATLCPQNYAGFAQANPKGVLQIIDPPLGPNGKSGAGTDNKAGQMYGMSKRAVDAGKGEAIARLMDWIDGPGYVLSAYGREGESYTRDASGAILQILEPPAVPFRQLAGWAYKGTDEELRSRYSGTTVQGDASTLDVFTDVLQRAAKLPKTDITPFAPLPPVPAERSADYTRTTNEGAFQFATGQRPFSEWDNYVQSVHAAGLDDWIAAAQQRGTEVGILK
jgi:putative aldouronate transport system substrate-binding protein